MRGLTFFVHVSVLTALASVVLASRMHAADGTSRLNERARLLDPSDAAAFARCLSDGLRRGTGLDPRLLIRANRGVLDSAAGTVFYAKDHRPPRPERLDQMIADRQAEAEWWHNPGARKLQPGEQFVTRNGKHRWTKVIAGSKEVWRSPDDLLVGDVVGHMTHLDAQRIDRALKALFDQAKQDVSGQWRWPEGLDPATFLRQEMGRRVMTRDLPSGGQFSIGSLEVARFFDPLMASVGGILAPDFPWRLPLQQGYGILHPGPTREFGTLRSQSVLEVLDDTFGRWFWSSSVSTRASNLAHVFYERSGEIAHNIRTHSNGSVRLVARRR